MEPTIYIVTSPLFGEKVRIFYTKEDLTTWMDRKVKIMTNALSKNDESNKNTIENDIINQIHIKEVNELNIGSGQKYPANALSNFAPHTFIIDGITCASMEGFLQSLKIKDPNMQIHTCALVGRAAKAAGLNRNQWKKRQILYWQGAEIKRDSAEYDQLIEKAFKQLAKNDGFIRALRASGTAKLEHSMGKRKKADTVLTRKEFTNILTKLRKTL